MLIFSLTDGPLFERLSEKSNDRVPIRVAFLGAPKSGKTSVIHRFATGEFGTGGGVGGEVGERVIDVRHKETGKVFEFTTLDFNGDPSKVDVKSLKGCHVVVVMLSLLVQVGGGGVFYCFILFIFPFSFFFSFLFFSFSLNNCLA